MIRNIPSPRFLYGTAWKEADTHRCVADAIASGFRGIDTANQRKHYFEAEVGQALKAAWESGLSRADFFIQTKFTSLGGQDARLPYRANAPIETQVQESFASSLEHLHTDHLDSLVLHGPSSAITLADEDWEAWRAMEQIHAKGGAKLLGISNVNLGQLKVLCGDAKVQPSFVQNRCYARRGWDQEIREFCRERAITYQGFSLLTANSEVFQATRFMELARRKQCTGAQLVFAFALGVGMLPLTGTTDSRHMAEDLLANQIELSAEELGTIESISRR